MKEFIIKEDLLNGMVAFLREQAAVKLLNMIFSESVREYEPAKVVTGKANPQETNPQPETDRPVTQPEE